MKTSRYNWFVNRDNINVIFNGFTGALIELDSEHKQLSNILVKEELPIDSSELLDNNTIKMLTESGFIVNDDFDERNYLETLMKAVRFRSALKITAVITRNCNFKCTYCIQSEGEHNKAVMSDETIMDMTQMISEVKPVRVHTTLYGGEPLLYPDICIKVLSAVNKYDSNAKAMLVTNGYLLDSALAETLSNNGVEVAQITIDGPEAVHNARRMKLDGSGSFKRIMRNVQSSSKFMKILIRVNADSDHAYNYREFRDSIATNSNIYVYRAPTTYDHKKNYAKRQDNLDMIQDEPCPDELYMKELNAKFPGCAATTLMNAVILPEGKLVRCWNQVQDSALNHSVSKTGLISSYKKWEQWNPFTITKCRNCKMLPTCGGGCPDKFLKTGIPQCRYTVESYNTHIMENYFARIPKP